MGVTQGTTTTTTTTPFLVFPSPPPYSPSSPWRTTTPATTTTTEEDETQRREEVLSCTPLYPSSRRMIPLDPHLIPLRCYSGKKEVGSCSSADAAGVAGDLSQHRGAMRHTPYTEQISTVPPPPSSTAFLWNMEDTTMMSTPQYPEGWADHAYGIPHGTPYGPSGIESTDPLLGRRRTMRLEPQEQALPWTWGEAPPEDHPMTSNTTATTKITSNRLTCPCPSEAVSAEGKAKSTLLPPSGSERKRCQGDLPPEDVKEDEEDVEVAAPWSSLGAPFLSPPFSSTSPPPPPPPPASYHFVSFPPSGNLHMGVPLPFTALAAAASSLMSPSSSVWDGPHHGLLASGDDDVSLSTEERHQKKRESIQEKGVKEQEEDQKEEEEKAREGAEEREPSSTSSREDESSSSLDPLKSHHSSRSSHSSSRTTTTKAPSWESSSSSSSSSVVLSPHHHKKHDAWSSLEPIPFLLSSLSLFSYTLSSTTSSSPRGGERGGGDHATRKIFFQGKAYTISMSEFTKALHTVVAVLSSACTTPEARRNQRRRKRSASGSRGITTAETTAMETSRKWEPPEKSTTANEKEEAAGRRPRDPSHRGPPGRSTPSASSSTVYPDFCATGGTVGGMSSSSSSCCASSPFPPPFTTLSVLQLWRLCFILASSSFSSLSGVSSSGSSAVSSPTSMSASTISGSSSVSGKKTSRAFLSEVSKNKRNEMEGEVNKSASSGETSSQTEQRRPSLLVSKGHSSSATPGSLEGANAAHAASHGVPSSLSSWHSMASLERDESSKKIHKNKEARKWEEKIACDARALFADALLLEQHHRYVVEWYQQHPECCPPLPWRSPTKRHGGAEREVPVSPSRGMQEATTRAPTPASSTVPYSWRRPNEEAPGRSFPPPPSAYFWVHPTQLQEAYDATMLPRSSLRDPGASCCPTAATGVDREGRKSRKDGKEKEEASWDLKERRQSVTRALGEFLKTQELSTSPLLPGVLVSWEHNPYVPILEEDDVEDDNDEEEESEGGPSENDDSLGPPPAKDTPSGSSTTPPPPPDTSRGPCIPSPVPSFFSSSVGVRGTGGSSSITPSWNPRMFLHSIQSLSCSSLIRYAFQLQQELELPISTSISSSSSGSLADAVDTMMAPYGLFHDVYMAQQWSVFAHSRHRAVDFTTIDGVYCVPHHSGCVESAPSTSSLSLPFPSSSSSPVSFSHFTEGTTPEKHVRTTSTHPMTCARDGGLCLPPPPPPPPPALPSSFLNVSSHRFPPNEKSNVNFFYVLALHAHSRSDTILTELEEEEAVEESRPVRECLPHVEPHETKMEKEEATTSPATTTASPAMHRALPSSTLFSSSCSRHGTGVSSRSSPSSTLPYFTSTAMFLSKAPEAYTFGCAAEYFEVQAMVVLDGDMGLEVGRVIQVWRKEEYTSYAPRESSLCGMSPVLCPSEKAFLRNTVYRRLRPMEWQRYFYTLPCLNMVTWTLLQRIRETYGQPWLQQKREWKAPSEDDHHLLPKEEKDEAERPSEVRQNGEDQTPMRYSSEQEGPLLMLSSSSPLPPSFFVPPVFRTCKIKQMEFDFCGFQGDGKKLTVGYHSQTDVRFLELATYLFRLFRCRVWMIPMRPSAAPLFSSLSSSLLSQQAAFASPISAFAVDSPSSVGPTPATTGTKGYTTGPSTQGLPQEKVETSATAEGCMKSRKCTAETHATQKDDGAAQKGPTDEEKVRERSEAASAAAAEGREKVETEVEKVAQRDGGRATPPVTFAPTSLSSASCMPPPLPSRTRPSPPMAPLLKPRDVLTDDDDKEEEEETTGAVSSLSSMSITTDRHSRLTHTMAVEKEGRERATTTAAARFTYHVSTSPYHHEEEEDAHSPHHSSSSRKTRVRRQGRGRNVSPLCLPPSTLSVALAHKNEKGSGDEMSSYVSSSCSCSTSTSYTTTTASSATSASSSRCTSSSSTSAAGLSPSPRRAPQEEVKAGRMTSGETGSLSLYPATSSSPGLSSVTASMETFLEVTPPPTTTTTIKKSETNSRWLVVPPPPLPLPASMTHRPVMDTRTVVPPVPRGEAVVRGVTRSLLTTTTITAALPRTYADVVRAGVPRRSVLPLCFPSMEADETPSSSPTLPLSLSSSSLPTRGSLEEKRKDITPNNTATTTTTTTTGVGSMVERPTTLASSSSSSSSSWHSTSPHPLRFPPPPPPSPVVSQPSGVEGPPVPASTRRSEEVPNDSPPPPQASVVVGRSTSPRPEVQGGTCDAAVITTTTTISSPSSTPSSTLLRFLASLSTAGVEVGSILPSSSPSSSLSPMLLRRNVGPLSDKEVEDALIRLHHALQQDCRLWPRSSSPFSSRFSSWASTISTTEHHRQHDTDTARWSGYYRFRDVLLAQATALWQAYRGTDFNPALYKEDPIPGSSSSTITYDQASWETSPSQNGDERMSHEEGCTRDTSVPWRSPKLFALDEEEENDLAYPSEKEGCEEEDGEETERQTKDGVEQGVPLRSSSSLSSSFSPAWAGWEEEEVYPSWMLEQLLQLRVGGSAGCGATIADTTRSDRQGPALLGRLPGGLLPPAPERLDVARVEQEGVKWSSGDGGRRIEERPMEWPCGRGIHRHGGVTYGTRPLPNVRGREGRASLSTVALRFPSVHLQAVQYVLILERPRVPSQHGTGFSGTNSTTTATMETSFIMDSVSSPAPPTDTVFGAPSSPSRRRRRFPYYYGCSQQFFSPGQTVVMDGDLGVELGVVRAIFPKELMIDFHAQLRAQTDSLSSTRTNMEKKKNSSFIQEEEDEKDGMNEEQEWKEVLTQYLLSKEETKEDEKGRTKNEKTTGRSKGMVCVHLLCSLLRAYMVELQNDPLFMHDDEPTMPCTVSGPDDDDGGSEDAKAGEEKSERRMETSKEEPRHPDEASRNRTPPPSSSSWKTSITNKRREVMWSSIRQVIQLSPSRLESIFLMELPANLSPFLRSFVYRSVFPSEWEWYTSRMPALQQAVFAVLHRLQRPGGTTKTEAEEERWLVGNQGIPCRAAGVPFSDEHDSSHLKRNTTKVEDSTTLTGWHPGSPLAPLSTTSTLPCESAPPRLSSRTTAPPPLTVFYQCRIQAMHFLDAAFQADGKKLHLLYYSDVPVRFLELATYFYHVLRIRVWVHEVPCLLE